MVQWFQIIKNSFPLGSHVKILHSGGGHLGFPIQAKIEKILKEQPMIYFLDMKKSWQA